MAAGFWLGLNQCLFSHVPGDRIPGAITGRSPGSAPVSRLLADFALLTLGGALKRKERISGRFADVLSNLYLCSCVLKHYQDQGCPADDAPLLNWACQQTLYRAQQSLLAMLWKLPMRPVAMLLR